MKHLALPRYASPSNFLTRGFLFAALIVLSLTGAARAQITSAVTGKPEVRIAAKVDNSKRTMLKGNTHPLTLSSPDLGPVDPSAPMQRMILTLTHSDAQETALGGLMAQQQDKNSPLYHQWLTPQQFGAQFGASDADIATITAWLTSQGFTVNRVGNGKSMIEFSGTAGQVTSAFQTPLHKFSLNGKTYQANTTDPSIPTALSSVVRGVLSLYNFPRQMHHDAAGTFQRNKATGALTRLTNPSKQIGGGTPAGTSAVADALGVSAHALKPDYTVVNGSQSLYTVAPYDFATIYNVLPLWNAGIDGTGQTIAVLEETDIHVDDVRAFRSIFGLPAKDPVFIVNGPDPGITNTDEEGEAVLDTEWSGAVAKNATIDFITSASTASTAGIDLSAIYAVDYNVAPVTSLSYGECESNLGTTGNAYYVALWQQGAAQGISHLVSTGDSGSDGCQDGSTYATVAPNVSGFASTPYNVAVGGTEFLGTLVSPTTFWSSTNNSTTAASALSYLPETTWNNNCSNPIFQTGVLGQTYGDYASAQLACAGLATFDGNNTLATVGGSGGYSTYSAKPSWQSGLGVPADGKRDIPDVSFLASNGSIGVINNAGTGINYYGSFYIVCQEDTNTNGQSCNLNAGPFVDFGGVGGTSVSTPAFAGIMALVNQKTNSRQGVANYVLYNLYNQQVAAGTACQSAYTQTGTGPITLGTPILPAANCVFNDITFGSNSAGCLSTFTDCSAASGKNYGVLKTPTTATPASTEAYLNGVGYDEAVGLGSVNANNLVNNWASVSFVPTTTTLSMPQTTFVHGTSISPTVTVALASGATGTPTGLIQIDTTTNPVALGSATLSGGTVTQAYTNFPGGTYSVSAYYDGDGTYAPSTSAATQITVTAETSTLTGKVQLENESTGALSTVSSCAYGAQCYIAFTPVGASGNGLPTGSVTVTNSGAAFATVPVSNGVASYSTTGGAGSGLPNAIPPGTYSFSGAYSGDASYKASSTTAATALTITQSGSKTTLTRGTTSIAAGASETLTATVVTSTSLTNGDNFGAYPSGTVSFYSGGTGGTLLGTVAFTSHSFNANSDAPQSIATLVTTGLPYSTTASSSDSITAVYSGDANYTTSTSAAGTVTVAKATLTATTSALSATNTPLTYGSSTTITDTISYTSSSTPTGNVTFYVDGVAYGAAISLATSPAPSVIIPTLAGGKHTVSAVYAGDTNFTGSTGSIALTVSANTTDRLTLAGSTASAIQGTTVVFTGTVSFPTGDANPTGFINFSVDGALTNSATAGSIFTGGVGAAFSTGSLLPGSHTITASYAGDANYAAATAASSVSVQISAAPLLTLSTNLHSVIVLGAPVSISAVAQTINGGPVPTGSIVYSVDGGAASSAITLSQGAASFSISGLDILKHTVVVTYSGDSNYASVSQALVLNSDIAQQLIFPGLPTAYLATTPTVALAVRSTSGLPVTYTVTGPATLSGSTLTLTGTGVVTITAAQTGNANFAAAASVTRSLNVQ